MSVAIDRNGTLKIDSVNLHTVSVQYYIINAELLFSRKPFLKDNTEGFSYVKPYHTLTHKVLPETADEQQMKNFIQKLLEELQERDLQELTPTNEEKNEWAKEGLVWDGRAKKFLYEI